MSKVSLACSLCDKRCCRDFLITVTPFDVLRIESFTGKKARSFAELAYPDILNVDWETALDCKDGTYLLALKSRPCIFFKDGKCSIFEAAPLACKLYPHTLSGRLNMSASCPFHSKVLFKIRNPGLSVLSQLKKELALYRELLHEYKEELAALDKDACFDFILEKAKAKLKS